jgi:hypothetical protein
MRCVANACHSGREPCRRPECLEPEEEFMPQDDSADSEVLPYVIVGFVTLLCLIAAGLHFALR